MRALAFLLVLFLVFGGAAYMVARLRQWKVSRDPWSLYESADNEQVAVYCFDPATERRLLVGTAPFADDDFDLQIELLRSIGRQKLVALNHNRKELSR